MTTKQVLFFGSSSLSRLLGAPRGRGSARARPSMILLSTLFVQGLVLAGCNSEATEVPIGEPGSAATPTSAPPPPAASASTAPDIDSAALKSACAKAALTLELDAIIATVDQATIFARDLGPGVLKREGQLLRTYCQEVANIRQVALDNLISDRLLEAEAKRQKSSVEEMLRARIEASAADLPPHAAIQQFYEERSPPNAPPLEEVREQVIAAMQRLKAEANVKRFIGDLKAKSSLHVRLPDVRPAALDVKIASHSAALGAKAPKVTVIEFADFECPYCSQAADAMRAMKDEFKGQPVAFAYRHYPLAFHPNAFNAAAYSQCANAQGKFWEFHDRVYENQRALGEPELQTYAEQVGLDLAALKLCLDSGQGAKEVEVDKAEGERLGVEGTPTFFINGRPLTAGPDETGLRAAILEALAGS